MSKFKVGDEVKLVAGSTGIIIEIGELGYDMLVQAGIGNLWCTNDDIECKIYTVYAVCDEKGEVLYIGLDEDCIWESYCGNVTISPQDKGYSIRPFHLTPINE